MISLHRSSLICRNIIHFRNILHQIIFQRIMHKMHVIRRADNWWAHGLVGLGKIQGAYLAHEGDARAKDPSTLYMQHSSFFFMWDYVLLLQVTWRLEMRQMKWLRSTCVDRVYSCPLDHNQARAYWWTVDCVSDIGRLQLDCTFGELEIDTWLLKENLMKIRWAIIVGSWDHGPSKPRDLNRPKSL